MGHTGAFVVGLSMVAVAGEAAACLDIGNLCEDAVGWFQVELLDTGDIALDGMLLFEPAGVNAPELSPAALEMAVTLDGRSRVHSRRSASMP